MATNHSKDQFNPDEFRTPAELKDTLNQLMELDARKAQFGETGQFPSGKLQESDEGEILFGVASYGDKIVLNFGKPVTWFAMSADQAQILSTVLNQKAEDVRTKLIAVKP